MKGFLYCTHSEVHFQLKRNIEIATCYDAFGDHEQASEWSLLLVSFADTLVKFTRPDSVVVYPYYPAIRNDTFTVGPKKRYLDLEVRVEYADSPIPNYWVRVDTPKIRNRGIHADSGGHSHSHTSPRRPVGRYIYPINSQDTLHAFTARTDDSGKVRFRYLASQFGGVERIRARLVSDTTTWDTLSVITRVPGLDSIPSGTNNIVTYTSPQAAQYHKLQNSNYAMPTTLNAVTSSVLGYAQEYGILNNNFLAVIDMSLPLGGGFDLHGGWEQDISGLQGAAGHEYHREGKSVDFSYFYRNAAGQVITVNIVVDGQLVVSTNRINDSRLDFYFDRNGFNRWERRIGKIHYESRN